MHKLSDLKANHAGEITRLHDEIGGHLRTSLGKAIRIGELLAQQKADLPHGAFAAWITKNLPFTERTARNYMTLYEHRDRLKTETVSDLTTAYRLLSRPQLPAGSESERNGRPSGGLLPPEEVEYLKRTEGGVEPDERGEDRHIERAQSPSLTPKLAETPRDADGREIPAHLLDVFAKAEQFERFAQALSTLKGQVTQAIEADPVAWSRFSDNAFRAGIDKLHDLFKLSSPFIVCSYCGASESDKCRACKGTGFLTKAQARCVPKEMRP